MDYSTLSIEEIRSLVTRVRYSHSDNNDGYIAYDMMLEEFALVSPHQRVTPVYKLEASASYRWTSHVVEFKPLAARLNELKVPRL